MDDAERYARRQTPGCTSDVHLVLKAQQINKIDVLLEPEKVVKIKRVLKL